MKVTQDELAEVIRLLEQMCSVPIMLLTETERRTGITHFQQQLIDYGKELKSKYGLPDNSELDLTDGEIILPEGNDNQ